MRSALSAPPRAPSLSPPDLRTTVKCHCPEPAPGLDTACAPAEDCNTTHEITITYRFEPDDLYLKTGDCVHFTNIHTIEHSAIGLEREFNTGVLMPNGTAIFRFDEPMAIPYVCGVHPLMVGVLVIEEVEEPPVVQ